MKEHALEEKHKEGWGDPVDLPSLFYQKKTIRYAYGSGELSAMYQKNSSQCYNKFGSPTEFIAQK
ncbi:hypothetical protein AMQ83_03125, partial [Paenibacillus riograndensis]